MIVPLVLFAFEEPGKLLTLVDEIDVTVGLITLPLDELGIALTLLVREGVVKVPTLADEAAAVVAAACCRSRSSCFASSSNRASLFRFDSASLSAFFFFSASF